jgi:hypothetical protein
LEGLHLWVKGRFLALTITSSIRPAKTRT